MSDLNTNGTKMQRLGVIEIGSRATRLLVADIQDIMSLNQVKSRVMQSPIIELVGGNEQKLRHELDSLAATIRSFVEDARRESVDRAFVFGTEAIRQLAETTAFKHSDLAVLVDSVLDARTEALCSLVAGNMSMRDHKSVGGDTVVIDQGSGSMEIAIGTVGKEIHVHQYTSSPLGGTQLLQVFRESKRSMGSLRAMVETILDSLPERWPPIGRIIVMGTVSTKFAWLGIRHDRSERYDPKRVDGASISLASLLKVYSHIDSFSKQKDTEAAWAEFQDFVNPGEQGGDAGERVATGIVPLIEILKKIGKSTCHVSAFGTRHGVAAILTVAPELILSKGT